MTEPEIKSKIASETPRVRKITLENFHNIPEEFKAVKQWHVYRFDPRKRDKAGAYPEKLGKPPVSPSIKTDHCLTGWQKKFLSFDQAVNALKANKPGNLAGIGLAFTGEEPFSGVDIDSCLKSGNLTPQAKEIIDRLNSYTEVSPSGTGLRIIGRGKLPEGDNGGKCGDYEAYSGGKDGARFLTMTGVVFDGKQTIREFSSDLAWFRKNYATSKPKEKPSPRGQQEARQSSGPLSDADIMAIIGKAKNSAKIQDLMSNQANSEDLAKLVNCLAFYSKDTDQIERIIRGKCTGREKWDVKRGESNFLVYEIKRLLAKYKGGGYEPKVIPQKKTFKDTLSVDTALQAGVNPREIYNPNRTTEMGNSERLFELAGNDIRFVKNIGWHAWKEGRWLPDEMAVREIFKKSVVSQLYRELSIKALAHDYAGIKELSSWAKKSEADRQIQGGLAMAASLEGIYIQPSDLDRDPWLLNVQNGTLDLKTGKLREHRREDVFTKICPVNFDPIATAPTWEKFLDRIMAGNQNLVGFLKRAIGYSLTGSVQAQCWFIAHGVGANGKGTFLNTILQMMGDYATQAAPDLLMMAKGDASRHPTEQADLFGKRLAVCQETEEGRRLAEVAVKQMTGGDRIKARMMRQDFFEFDPTHKLWLATNHKPVIKDTTVSTWRRIRMIPFSVVIPENERDETLSEKLKAELPGILAWAVEGCLEWQRDGLKPPKDVIAATNQYKESQDILSAFISERCFLPEKAPWAVKTSATNLYKAYTEWCEASGERPKAQRVFGEALTEKGYKRVRAKNGYVYEGIGILTNGEPCEPCEPKPGINSTRENTKLLIPESRSLHTQGSPDDDEEEIQ